VVETLGTFGQRPFLPLPTRISCRSEQAKQSQPVSDLSPAHGRAQNRRAALRVMSAEHEHAPLRRELGFEALESVADAGGHSKVNSTAPRMSCGPTPSLRGELLFELGQAGRQLECFHRLGDVSDEHAERCSFARCDLSRRSCLSPSNRCDYQVGGRVARRTFHGHRPVASGSPTPDNVPDISVE
jgi:hypothetical protein